MNKVLNILSINYLYKGIVLIAIATFAFYLSVSPIYANEIKGLAIIGDSLSDEYQGTDPRGSKYKETTLNWVELLAKKRDVNLGKWDDWDEPRRTGYEFNFARSGSTISDVLDNNTHTEIAKLVKNGDVSDVIILIGANDFAPWTANYTLIYTGILKGDILDKKLAKYNSDLNTALTTITQAGDVNIIISTVPDSNSLPAVQKIFNDTKKRKLVSNAIAKFNSLLKKTAKEKNVKIANFDVFIKSIIKKVDKDKNLKINNQKITIKSGSDKPNYLFLKDNVHPGTVLSGLIANFYIQNLNKYSDTKIEKFSDVELIKNAGL